jgi:hypothetical protein
MPRELPTARPFLGALRYGPSSASGPDPASRFLEMSPGDLATLGCYDFYTNAEVILSAKAQFSEAQRAALIARADECAGSAVGAGGFFSWTDPRLLIEGAKEVAADPVGAITGALGADGLLSGVADVVGNTVLALGGITLVVLGVLRLFGVQGAKVATAAVTRGRG